MNWGNKLILAFIVFAGLMTTLVYKCTRYTFDLVSNDYYADELKYQDQIDGMNNAAKLSKLSIDQNDANIIISMPEELAGKNISGQAWFYCANNAGMDRKISLDVNGADKQFISKKDLAKTNYTVKVNWKSDGQLYYAEQHLTVK